MMSLSQTHKGWENERFAAFLLSRIAFVSSPLSVGDDAGTDLFATLFEAADAKRGTVLVPLNSIAVQVKSSRRPLDITSKLGYLARLEVPYFVAVANHEYLTLEVYSGRYLSNMLSLGSGGRPVRLVLVDELGDDWRVENDLRCDVKCPLVTTLNADDDADARVRKATLIRYEAGSALKSIASRLNNEFIFDLPNARVEIFTGKDSAAAFHENFVKRLAEGLHNLAWSLENGRSVRDDFIEAYIQSYAAIAKLGLVEPYLSSAHDRLMRARGSA